MVLALAVLPTVATDGAAVVAVHALVRPQLAVRVHHSRVLHQVAPGARHVRAEVAAHRLGHVHAAHVLVESRARHEALVTLGAAEAADAAMADLVVTHAAATVRRIVTHGAVKDLLSTQGNPVHRKHVAYNTYTRHFLNFTTKHLW